MKNQSLTFNSKDIANTFKRLKQDAAGTQASDLFPITSKLPESKLQANVRVFNSKFKFSESARHFKIESDKEQ
jgi:hypothetical protein